MSDLRYPIGQLKLPVSITEEHLKSGIETLKTFPDQLKTETLSLDQKQLDTPYRAGGWTIRQVIHHVSESHMNGFIRFKWALTEDIPIIKAYHEDRWALFSDDVSMPVKIGLSLIEALHQKWVYLLESFTETEWNKSYFHPEDDNRYQLRESLLVYQWHSKHHLAHITMLKERNRW